MDNNNREVIYEYHKPADEAAAQTIRNRCRIILIISFVFAIVSICLSVWLLLISAVLIAAMLKTFHYASAAEMEQHFYLYDDSTISIVQSNRYGEIESAEIDIADIIQCRFFDRQYAELGIIFDSSHSCKSTCDALGAPMANDRDNYIMINITEGSDLQKFLIEEAADYMPIEYPAIKGHKYNRIRRGR